jgi:2'-5' RNA ligase
LAHIFKPGSGTVAKEPLDSKEFKARADRATMHPILVAKLPDGSHDVIDGTHRTHKALAQGDTHIQAYVIPWDKLPDHARVQSHEESSAAVAPERKDCGVFIPLPYDIARLFPKKTNDTSEPHITMLFAGALTPAEYGQLVARVALLGRALPPFYMDVGSYFEFETPNNLTVAAVRPNGRGYMPIGPGKIAPRLAAVHELLVTSATLAGLKIAHDYGKNTKKAPPHEKFLPHVTLAYLPAGERYCGPRPEGTWLVTELECWGWEKIRLPLGHLQIDQPAPG